ncbi:M48 family metallopeptidase [Candidatus Peregrinibacteria bacterium]|nr:M48 family metallopeptidase [Candidatus Peregrinibacteria bacterium]
MNKEITLYDRKISYSIRKSTRAKRLRIAVYCNCDVVVTLPHHKTVSDVEVYLKQKSKWISEKLDYFREAKRFKVKNKSVSYAYNKEKAYKLAIRIIKKFNNIYGFKYNKITIKNHKTKWGSCSKKGNLNFNYRIVFLPQRLAEYIVAHELCHLGELGHSRKYWNLVERALPNYKDLIRELKKN